MNRRKFITTCACCTSALLLPFAYKKMFNKNSIERMQIDLVQHCNLNCKYCDHFSCIAEKGFYNPTTFENDMAQISKLCNKQLSSLGLLGGEPLLHPNINDLIKISRKHFPFTDIFLITNSILLNKMPESFWKTLNKNHIYLLPCVYPIDNIDWKSIYNKATKYNVLLIANYRKHLYKSSDEIMEYKVNNFRKMTLNIKGEDKKWKYCKYTGTLLNLYNGKLYPCSIIANIRHFNKKFNKNIPVTEKDYIDIYKVKSSKEINDFLNSNIPFCKYCCGTQKAPKVKWGISSEHDISEWT